MLIILFAAIIIFLSPKSRFNRAHMEGSRANYSGGCGGGSPRLASPPLLDCAAGAGGERAGRGREGQPGGPRAFFPGCWRGSAEGGRRRTRPGGGGGRWSETQQLITSNSPTVTKSPARNKNLIC